MEASFLRAAMPSTVMLAARTLAAMVGSKVMLSVVMHSTAMMLMITVSPSSMMVLV